MIRMELVDASTAWRGRGRQPREVPAEVRELADSTYRTENVAEFANVLTEADRRRVREVISYARTYANGLGRRIRVQPQCWERSPHGEEARKVTVVRFMMVDKRSTSCVPRPRQAPEQISEQTRSRVG